MLEIPDQELWRTKPQDAQTAYDELSTRIQVVDDRPDSFWHGVEAPDMREVVLDGAAANIGHRLLVLNETTPPGGAFKYYGALNALQCSVDAAASVGQEVTEVTTGSAGNLGLTLTIAARLFGIQSRVYLPESAAPAKVAALQDAGAQLAFVESERVEDAIQRARDDSLYSPGSVFIHPYNNPDGIAGQSMVGKRLLNGLIERDADLHDDYELAQDTEILSQLGGGSLTAGIALRVEHARQQGMLNDNARLFSVRPEGGINKKYDGLAVREPGSWAVPILADRRFVTDILYASEADTRLAGEYVHETFGIAAEFSALAGIAAALGRMRQAGTPSTFVAVLSGKNITAQDYDSYMRSAAVSTPWGSGSIASRRNLIGYAHVTREYNPNHV